MRSFPAVIIGQLIAFIIKTLKLGGGSAAPGLYALKLNPNLISDLAKLIPKSIIVTGTNGKTTTARLIAHFAKSHGLRVLKNHTGSNLERGIASTLIAHYSSLSKFDLAIWEVDEAAFNTLALKLNPQIVVILNVFRDQLDRYGEVDSVVKKWRETISNLDSSTLLLLNGDDENVASLAKDFRGNSETFGVKDYSISGESIKKEPHSKRDFEAQDVAFQGLEGTKFDLFINHESLIINLPIPGLYHIYDFLAAFAAGFHLNFNVSQMIDSLKNYSPAFGRFEKFELTPLGWESGKKKNIGYIFLIKNPAGATQVFQTIAPELTKDDRLLIALNDNFADGKDVSWIWDAEYEKLKVKGQKLEVICTGTRAQDLALRLKYAGFDPKLIKVENNLEKAFNRACGELEGRLFILPTYTALLEMQQFFAKKKLKEHYWKNL